MSRSLGNIYRCWIVVVLPSSMVVIVLNDFVKTDRNGYYEMVKLGKIDQASTIPKP